MISAPIENRLTQFSSSAALVSSQQSTSQVSAAAPPPPTGNNSLLNNLIKLLHKTFVFLKQEKSTPIIQKYVFQILTNCAGSNECKNLVSKSNLLMEFTNIDFQAGSNANIRLNVRLEKLWLAYLLSLSFWRHGQDFIVKSDGLLPALVRLHDYYRQYSAIGLQTQQHLDIQYLTLLILRNLAFSPLNKSKLISNCKCSNF